MDPTELLLNPTKDGVLNLWIKVEHDKYLGIIEAQERIKAAKWADLAQVESELKNRGLYKWADTVDEDLLPAPRRKK